VESVLKLSKKLAENMAVIKKELGIGISFDIIAREMIIGGHDAVLVFVDGFAKDDVLAKVMEVLQQTKREEIAVDPIKKIINLRLPYIETDTVAEMEELIDTVLAGPSILLIDGQDVAIVIDARTYPARSPDEPDIEKVTRGARDGFVETIVFNTALIRRRIRDPKLRVELIQSGQRSKTDIAVLYIADIVNPELVTTIKERIKNIKVDALPMAEKTVEEYITRNKFSFFPTIRYTERPDVACAHLMEGHVLVVVDTSPGVIIAPVTFFHHLQHAEEYRQNPIIGTYLRWVRFFGIIFSFIIPALWLALVQGRNFLPAELAFLGPKEPGEIPLFLQLVLASVGIDLLRMASIHIPSPLATSLGIIGSFMLGEFAVQVGWVSTEVVLYMAVAAVGTFATPSLELALSLNFMRLLLLLFTGFFKVWGLVAGLAGIFLMLALTKSFGVPYLWPLVPFNGRALLTVIFRRPTYVIGQRPEALKTSDSTPGGGNSQ